MTVIVSNLHHFAIFYANVDVTVLCLNAKPLKPET